MLKGFRNILLKELKELVRDPKILIGIIIVPVIIFPVIGAIIGYAQQTAIEEAKKPNLLVLDNDGGNWSKALVAYLDYNATISILENTSPQDVVNQGLLKKYNTTQFIEIPLGFSKNMTLNVSGDWRVTATVNIFDEFTVGGLFSSIDSAGVTGRVYAFNRVVAPDALSMTQSVIIEGEIQQNVNPAMLSAVLLTQSIALPITIMILLTYSMQIAATSVAMEKEEKTLETLLTLPVDRFAVLMGKLSSAAIVSGIGALAYMIGYSYMLGSMTIGMNIEPGIDLAALGLVPSSLGYTLLGITLFVTLLAGLALAVIMSAFAEDVRGATALVGYVYPLIFIPSLVIMYLDINTLPTAVKAVLYAIPFSQPVIASKAVIVGDYLTVALGIIYVTAFTLVVMYIASRLFATEKILTAKIRVKGKGSKKSQEE